MADLEGAARYGFASASEAGGDDRRSGSVTIFTGTVMAPDDAFLKTALERLQEAVRRQDVAANYEIDGGGSVAIAYGGTMTLHVLAEAAFTLDQRLKAAARGRAVTPREGGRLG